MQNKEFGHRLLLHLFVVFVVVVERDHGTLARLAPLHPSVLGLVSAKLEGVHEIITRCEEQGTQPVNAQAVLSVPPVPVLVM